MGGTYDGRPRLIWVDLMIWSIDDYEVSFHVPIENNIHDKQHLFNLTLQEVFFEKKP